MLPERHFYEFDGFRVDPDERKITHGGKSVHLSSKAFDVLVLLLKHHGHLVRKTQIIAEVWPDSYIEEGNLNVQITTIRKALGIDYIEAVPKQGYRFTAKVIESTRAPEDESADLPKSKLLIWLTAVLLLLVVGGGLYVAFRSGIYKAPVPTGAAALYERALEYERVGDDEQALATLDQTLAREPRYQAACVRAAFLAYELEQDQKASGYLKSCRASDTSDELLRLKAQGLTEALADDSNRALEIYQLLIDRYPQDADGLYRFAELATDKDRLEEAEKALRRCLNEQADNRYCWFQLMYVEIKQNRFNDVLAQYNNLPQNVRDYPWFDEPVGIAFFGNAQLNDAGRIFSRLTDSQQRLHGTSHFTVAKEWLADLLLYQGRVKDATLRIEQVMGTSDNAQSLADSLAYLGHIHVLAGDEKQAAMFANRAASAPSATPFALVNAALVLANVGDSASVERVLKLRSEGTHNPLSANNDHLVRGVLAVATGDTARGIEQLRLARDLNPRDEEAAYQLGTAYFRARDYERALNMFQAVNDLRGTVLLDNVPLLLPLSKYWSAQCYEHLGDGSSAKSKYAELAAAWSDADEDLRRKFLK